MADNKFISNKEKRKQEADANKVAYRSPSKTTWGKITIIALCLAMVAAPVIYLIYYLISKL